MTAPPKLWTESELAAYFQVSEITISRERKRGKLKYTLVGKKIRYTEPQIHEYLKDQQHPSIKLKASVSLLNKV